MTSKELLFRRIDMLSEQGTISLFSTVTFMTGKHISGMKPDCLYRGSHVFYHIKGVGMLVIWPHQPIYGLTSYLSTIWKTISIITF